MGEFTSMDLLSLWGSKKTKNQKKRGEGSQFWTEAEDKFIADNMDVSDDVLATMINRTAGAIKARKFLFRKERGKTKSIRHWTAEEDAKLTDYVGKYTFGNICKKLNRSRSSVFNRMRCLGLSGEVKNEVPDKKRKYVHWTKEADEKLAAMKKEGYLDEYIANEIGRKKSAVHSRWHRIKNNYK